jgi:transketolase
MALAARILRQDFRVLVVLSDGECNEGSTWEAAMFAPAHRLDAVTIVVDYNKWQATGRSDEIMALSPLAAKWQAFGWSAVEVDGHDFTALVRAMQPGSGQPGKPVAIIANTVKGRGISFMQDDNNWHYRIPKDTEVAAARKELGLV